MKHTDRILRGQMYYADLDPVIGSEQGGIRPVVVLQNDVGNLFSPTVIVAPITTQIKKTGQPTHVAISSRFDLPEQSMAMLEQIRTIDKSRLGKLLGSLDEEAMDRIDRAVRISIGWHDVSPIRQKETHEVYHDPLEEEPPFEMVLCLCLDCASQFYNSPNHIIRRVDPFQQVKDTCTYCDVRTGYNYRIIRRKKRMGDDLV